MIFTQETNQPTKQKALQSTITHRPIKVEKNNYGSREKQKMVIGKKGNVLCSTCAKTLEVESRG